MLRRPSCTHIRRVYIITYVRATAVYTACVCVCRHARELKGEVRVCVRGVGLWPTFILESLARRGVRPAGRPTDRPDGRTDGRTDDEVCGCREEQETNVVIVGAIYERRERAEERKRSRWFSADRTSLDGIPRRGGGNGGGIRVLLMSYVCVCDAETPKLAHAILCYTAHIYIYTYPL